jgi:hypothetical protein
MLRQLSIGAFKGWLLGCAARDASGQQNLVFAIENVTGQAQAFIDDALTAGDQITATYRD